MIRFHVVVLLMSAVAGLAQTPCERLKDLSLPNVTITTVEAVPAGPFQLPRRPAALLAARCRVVAVLAPSADSHIGMELWLPTKNWNGKFAAVGNGGWSGAIQYESNNLIGNSMIAAFTEGYATASTDRGLTGGPKSLLGAPEKVVDFGGRSLHEAVVASKSIIAAFYGKPPKLSYFHGCSSGGQEGLMEAQRYPEDFDGIVAGSPANYWTHLMASILWDALAIQKDRPGYLPTKKLSLLHDAVLAACDALDGVKDGVLEDPTKCTFDPRLLECKGADMPGCLTSAQVEGARKMYEGVVNPRTNEQIFPGKALGSELGWTTTSNATGAWIAQSYFIFVVFQDPSWDFRKFDFDKDVTLADKIDSGTINAINPNLQPFFEHGGKLIQYHGWSDQTISPFNSVDYYNSVRAQLGSAAKLDDSYRLFMVPGMLHCGGDPGPELFNPISALERWRESNEPPSHLTAVHVTTGSLISNGVVNTIRLVCPFPQIAVYSGTGSTKDATNFSCKLPPRN